MSVEEDLEELQAFQECISSVDTHSIPDNHVQELRLFDCLIGSMRAFDKGYLAIAQFLMERIRHYIALKVAVVSSGFAQQEVRFHLHWFTHMIVANSNMLQEIAFPLNISQTYREEERLLNKYNAQNGPMHPRAKVDNLLAVIPSSSCLPLCTFCKETISTITHAPIESSFINVDYLDSKVSVGEAIMLSRVLSLWIMWLAKFSNMRFMLQQGCSSV